MTPRREQLGFGGELLVGGPPRSRQRHGQGDRGGVEIAGEAWPTASSVGVPARTAPSSSAVGSIRRAHSCISAYWPRR